MPRTRSAPLVPVSPTARREEVRTSVVLTPAQHQWLKLRAAEGGWRGVSDYLRGVVDLMMERDG